MQCSSFSFKRHRHCDVSQLPLSEQHQQRAHCNQRAERASTEYYASIIEYMYIYMSMYVALQLGVHKGVCTRSRTELAPRIALSDGAFARSTQHHPQTTRPYKATTTNKRTQTLTQLSLSSYSLFSALDVSPKSERAHVTKHIYRMHICIYILSV